MTFKPHFRKVDGRWRLYRDRKEFRRGCLIWYALMCETPAGMWREFEEMRALPSYYGLVK